MSELLVVGIETTGAAGSVALRRGNTPLGETALGEGTLHGASLHPALAGLLTAAGFAPADLGLVVVGTGPGSFTGMRVGVGAARTLAFALGIPVIGVASFDALAADAPREAPSAAVVRDARREHVYFALYGPAGRDGVREVTVPPARILAIEAAGHLAAGTVVLGEHAALLASLAPGGTPGARPDLPVSADRLARLGLARFLAGGAPDPAGVLPLYLQEPSAQPSRRDPARG